MLCSASTSPFSRSAVCVVGGWWLECRRGIRILFATQCIRLVERIIGEHHDRYGWNLASSEFMSRAVSQSELHVLEGVVTCVYYH
jgi:hypothetical protein